MISQVVTDPVFDGPSEPVSTAAAKAPEPTEAAAANGPASALLMMVGLLAACISVSGEQPATGATGATKIIGQCPARGGAFGRPHVNRLRQAADQQTELSLQFTMPKGMGGPHDFRVDLKTDDPTEEQKELVALSNWVE